MARGRSAHRLGDRVHVTTARSVGSDIGIASRAHRAWRVLATVAYRVRAVTMAYYDKMAAMALKQDQRIAELEAENAALKVKVDTLQAELAEFKAPHVNGKPKETTIREEVSDEMSHTPHAMSSAI